MREIKFRGKRLDNKEWVYGDLVHNSKKEPTWIMLFGDTPRFILVTEKSIGQYTGVKDKNGKEIYEGDIIQYTFDSPESLYATENGLKVRISKVFWSEWRGSFAVGDSLANNDLFNYVRNGNRVEVIGNIYENKELLEVE